MSHSSIQEVEKLAVRRAWRSGLLVPSYRTGCVRVRGSQRGAGASGWGGGGGGEGRGGGGEGRRFLGFAECKMTRNGPTGFAVCPPVLPVRKTREKKKGKKKSVAHVTFSRHDVRTWILLPRFLGVFVFSQMLHQTCCIKR